jgi:hypothetical protein
VQVPKNLDGWSTLTRRQLNSNNRNQDNQDNGNDNDRNFNGNNDNNNDVLYSKVATLKTRKKGVRSKPMTLKKKKSKGMTKCNKKSQHNNNTSISHDFVICGEGVCVSYPPVTAGVF